MTVYPNRLHLVLREHRLVFMHVPKCAGTSVKQAIAEATGLSLKYCKHLRPAWDTDRVVAEGRDFFKFTVVRNPYDRLVSFWEHNVRNGGPGTSALPPGVDFPGLVNFVLNVACEKLDPHMRPMASLLVRDGNLVPDMVLRQEDLQQHWPMLCQVVEHFCGLKLSEVLTQERKSPGRKPYREYDWGGQVEAFAEKFYVDRKLFGYRW